MGHPLQDVQAIPANLHLPKSRH